MKGIIIIHFKNFSSNFKWRKSNLRNINKLWEILSKEVSIYHMCNATTHPCLYFIKFPSVSQLVCSRNESIWSLYEMISKMTRGDKDELPYLPLTPQSSPAALMFCFLSYFHLECNQYSHPIMIIPPNTAVNCMLPKYMKTDEHGNKIGNEVQDLLL